MSKTVLESLRERERAEEAAFVAAEKRYKRFSLALLAAKVKNYLPSAKTLLVETDEMQGEGSEAVYSFVAINAYNEEGEDILPPYTEDEYDWIQDAVTENARGAGWDDYPKKGQVRKIDLDEVLSEFQD